MFRVVIASVFAVALVVPTSAQNPPQTPPAAPPQAQGGGRGAQTPEQIKAQRDREVENQKLTDAAWRKGSEGVMKMEKITYKSKAGGMTIPAFVFTPLQPRGPKGHPALVWVHPDIRGHVYEYYIPYVQEAVKRGYVVIAPEYRGSYGYGQEHYDAIDYGGEEVDDVTSAVDYLKTMPIVDIDRVGIIGWSHGGMITLLAAERETKLFKAVAALVPVTNLFQRLAWNGVEQRKAGIDPANRYGGLPYQKHDEYKRRSPIYQIDNIDVPLLVHITRNDGDVVFEEAAQLVDALRARKPFTAETKIYDNPLGGHLFDRMCPATLPNQGGRRGGAAGAAGQPPTPPDPTDLSRYVPTNTPEQRDSWNRVWTFLDWNLRPYQGAASSK
jgi:dipeptidyl aminopeptidase/acylaminoacyl peptidase